MRATASWTSSLRRSTSLLSEKWRAILALALASLLAMSLWFSASAVTPAIAAQWHLSEGNAAWLTMAVQLGFVAGAFLGALFNVSDLWPPRVVFCIGAVVGAAANGLIPFVAHGLDTALPLRFLTGLALAFVYPVGMKILATWTKEDRGLGIGLLVGALCVGSASPHLVKTLGGIDAWQPVMYATSVLAVIGGLIGLVAGHLGPHRAARARFQWRYLATTFSDRSLRLANFGYLGHMWELYAMWTWIPVFLAQAWGGDPRTAALVAFATIGVGGVGSVLAGVLADRWGRSKTTIASMAISGACALVIGLCLDLGPVVVTLVALVWGFAVVADSAQFSTAVSELGQPEYVGTQLTTQTCLGFLLTIVSIRLMPILVAMVGWRWAFATLAIGPAFGIVAMRALLRSPESARLAGGRG